MKTKQEILDLLKSDVQAFNQFRIETPDFKIDLSGVDLKYANLRDSDLTGANLTTANLTFANLICANLTHANLTGADLRDATLIGANLTHANLTGADLRDSDLSGAILKYVNLTGAILIGAKLTHAILTGANLDFSSWPLWCGSLTPKTDEKQRIQLFFHAASLIKHAEAPTEREIEIYNLILDYVNEFHRNDVKRLEEIK